MWKLESRTQLELTCDPQTMSVWNGRKLVAAAGVAVAAVAGVASVAGVSVAAAAAS